MPIDRGSRNRVERSEDLCPLQRFSRDDGLFFSLQTLHFQQGVQAAIRLAIRSSSPIRPCKVLAVINGEIQMV